jgi:hypothetical protein
VFKNDRSTVVLVDVVVETGDDISPGFPYGHEPV